MKINPVGIQAYQQVDRRSFPTGSPAEGEALHQNDRTFTISPQAPEAVSRLAVRPLKGNYSDVLTPEERRALELVFAHLRNSARFGAAYERDIDAAGEGTTLGRIIDLKA
ncbi:MAG TPA: hypothetical protein VN285_06870 [Candidatus Deferrimicrobium sp.]|nr:hypothetical protein [Candidatus Deferrimicrobium sp.]